MLKPFNKIECHLKSNSNKKGQSDTKEIEKVKSESFKYLLLNTH